MFDYIKGLTCLGLIIDEWDYGDAEIDMKSQVGQRDSHSQIITI